MPLRGLFQWVICVLLLSAAWVVHASPANNNIIPPEYISAPEAPQRPKPVAVIYFKNSNPEAYDHTSAIETMVLEARREFRLQIETYPLATEALLATTVDTIAEGDTGMIVIIAPKDTTALMKIPGLYPDIHFSIIGSETPIYLINVHSLTFSEQEGGFISGALAALQSKTGTVSFVSSDDTTSTRNFAYAYLQGAKYINPQVQVVQQLGAQPVSRQQSVHESNADITFVMDDELLPAMLQQAKEKKRLLITQNPGALSGNSKEVLTSLIKHYDFALYRSLKSHANHTWAPGTHMIGLGNGYIDYVVDSHNRGMFDKDHIERTERTKDLVSQGVVKINPLAE
jgi:basic membrane protein A